MDTKQKLESALKDAMRANNLAAKRTLRVLLTNIKLAEVEKGGSLDEAALIAAVQKEIKNRSESIQDAERAARPDMIIAFQEDIAVLETFLPEQLSREELDSLVRSAVAETGASGPADMGKVMKVLLPRVAGRAAGDQVSQAVRQLLTSN